MSIKENFFHLYKKEIGKHLREIREAKGLSQLDLAVRCDLEKTAISRIENGRTNITLKTSIVLAQGLDVELWEIYRIKINLHQ